MKESIDIRAATEEDLPEVLDIYAQPEIDAEITLPIIQAKEIFNKISSYPNYHIYVACINGKVRGTFALLIMDNLGHLGALSAIVEDVAVHPDFQGQGIGKAMMKFAFQLCKESRCYKVVLSSNKKRKNAHEFYKSLGFKQHGYSFELVLNQ